MDAAALQAFVSGDQAAFEALFREHQREVYAWIVRLVRDPAAAEDLTIETFWRIYRSRARFDPSRSFGAWARRIAVNVAIDHLNRAAADRARFAPLRGCRRGSRRRARAATRTAAPAADRDARRSIVRAFTQSAGDAASDGAPGAGRRAAVSGNRRTARRLHRRGEIARLPGDAAAA